MKAGIVYKYKNIPYGIRNRDGYLLFFHRITRYPNQEERYEREIGEQINLAEFLCSCLNNPQQNKEQP